MHDRARAARRAAAHALHPRRAKQRAYPWPWLSYLALHHCGVFVREPPSLMKLHAFVLSTEHAINDGAVEMQVIERGAEPMEKVHRPEAGICWCAGTAGLEAVLECFEKDP